MIKNIIINFNAIVPIGWNELALKGVEGVTNPGILMSNIAQGGATLAVAFKTKNKELKQMATTSGISALVGITEPALYGVTLRLKRPLMSAMIAGAMGGLYCGIMEVVRFSAGPPTGIFILPLYVIEGKPYNIIHVIIACLISFISSFVLTIILGFKDEIEENTSKENTTEEIKPQVKNSNILLTVYSFANGKLIPLKDVKDEAFSSEALGKGVAIIPTEGKVYSPIKGTVSSIFPTNHAIGLESDEGLELLLHIGIDTVQLNGQFFKSIVKEGDSVEIGDLLIEFDKDEIIAKGYDVTTPLIITNSGDYSEIIKSKATDVEVKDEILTIF